MVAHCAMVGAPLAALTIGRRWLLLFQSTNLARNVHRFCETDLTGGPNVVAGDLNRYLSWDRIICGQAAWSAERTLRDQSREVVNRQAILDGWRRVVLGLHEGLLELVATAAEPKAGYRPEMSLVSRVLKESRGEHLPSALDHGALSGTEGGASRGRPASFTLLSETQAVSSWADLLVGVSLAVYERHPEDFEKVLEIRGRRLPYFSRPREDVHQPKSLGDTGIYASCQGTGTRLEGRARRVVELCGYPADSLAAQSL